MDFFEVLVAVILASACLFVFLLVCRFVRHRRGKTLNRSDFRLAVVVGSGGHTAEILRLVSTLGVHYSRRFYIVADTDSTSLPRINKVELAKKSGSFEVVTVPRGREVRQSYFTSIWTTLLAIFRCITIVFSLRPDLVLCNGPGTCVPICALAFFFDLVLFRTCRIVYVESICRVESLSLTGKILYHLRLTDAFLVQWPRLTEIYPRSMYVARF